VQCPAFIFFFLRITFRFCFCYFSLPLFNVNFNILWEEYWRQVFDKVIKPYHVDYRFKKTLKRSFLHCVIFVKINKTMFYDS